MMPLVRPSQTSVSYRLGIATIGKPATNYKLCWSAGNIVTWEGENGVNATLREKFHRGISKGPRKMQETL